MRHKTSRCKRDVRDVKGGGKVSHCGGGKGDHNGRFISVFGGGWSEALRRPSGRRVKGVAKAASKHRRCRGQDSTMRVGLSSFCWSSGESCRRSFRGYERGA